jgi:hypothetical protein
MKMAAGLKKARARREAKAAEVARQSGVVTGKGQKNRWRGGRKERPEDDITPDNIRGPVMYVGGGGN